MSGVKGWNDIGQNQRVKIMTVDPASRKVEAATKDGAMIQVAVWGQPTIFRWPIVGEIWIVCRMSGYWILVEPVQKEVEESAPLEGLNPGDVNVTTGEGGQFLVNGQPIGGGSDVWAFSGPSDQVARTRPGEGANNSFLRVNGNWWLPVDAVTSGHLGGSDYGLYGDSGGWTTFKQNSYDSGPLKLLPPEAGFYIFGCSFLMEVDLASANEDTLFNVNLVSLTGDAAVHRRFQPFSYYKTEAGGAVGPTYSATGAAYLDPSVAINSSVANGIGVTVGTFNDPPATVRWFGQPQLWARKV